LYSNVRHGIHALTEEGIKTRLQDRRQARLTGKIPEIETLLRKISSKQNGLTCEFKNIAHLRYLYKKSKKILQKPRRTSKISLCKRTHMTKKGREMKLKCRYQWRPVGPIGRGVRPFNFIWQRLPGDKTTLPGIKGAATGLWSRHTAGSGR